MQYGWSIDLELLIDPFVFVLVEFLVEVIIPSVVFVFTVVISIIFANGFINTMNVRRGVVIDVAILMGVDRAVLYNVFFLNLALFFNPKRTRMIHFSFFFVHTIEIDFLLFFLFQDQNRQRC